MDKLDRAKEAKACLKRVETAVLGEINYDLGEMVAVDNALLAIGALISHFELKQMDKT